jgi:glycine hydroxymethyltransferase
MGLTGDVAQPRLESLGLPCNKNLIPADPQPLAVSSGLRFGTSAVTTRGLRRPELASLAELIADVLDDLTANGRGTSAVAERVRDEVAGLARRFPIYSR